MNKVRIANIVKKLTELPQEDRKELTNILLKGLENGVPASEFNEVKEDVNALKGKNYVLYDNQELTEEQQMQVRKNLDLYYSEGTPAGVITWDGNTEGKEQISLDYYTVYKIADAPLDLPISKIIKVLNANGDEFTFAGGNLNPESGRLEAAECMLGSEFGGFFIADNPHFNVSTPFEGLSGIYVTENIRTIEYDAYGETIHHIEPKYIEQATEEGNMDVRKRLGLYYEEKTIERLETSPDQDVQIIDDTISIGAQKVSDIPIDANYLIGEKFGYGQQGMDIEEIVITNDMIVSDVNYTRILVNSSNPDYSPNWAIAIVPEDTTIGTHAFSKGIWLVQDTHWLDVPITKTSQIPPKYIKDMYYEEEGIGEKRIETSLEDCQAKVYDPDYFRVYTKNNVYHMFFKISEDTPAPTDIISFINGNNETILPSDENFVLNQYDGYFGAGYLGNNFYVASENVNATIDGHTTNLTKGIWVHGLGYGSTTVSDLDCYELVYNGEVTIIHQIPSKYLPGTGIQTYDINIDWIDLDTIIRQGYGYGQNEFTEEEYDKLCEALGNGKMIALNIGSGPYGYPGGKFLTGNYLPLNAQNEDGYISEIIFPIINWPSYNPNTGTITGNASYTISLKCGYGIETEEFKYQFVATSVNP